jgi:hypothetical protein
LKEQRFGSHIDGVASLSLSCFLPAGASCHNARDTLFSGIPCRRRLHFEGVPEFRHSSLFGIINEYVMVEKFCPLKKE